MSDSSDPSATPALATRGPASRPARRSYHVALTPKQVLDRLSEQTGVKAYEASMLPDFGGLIEDAEYTLELGEREFTMHCGPPAARGQSATGMLRLLYLRGRLRPTEDGTLVELGFAYRRPRWALQRWVGFLALGGLGLVWVLIGPGVLAKKALLYGALMLVVGPVLAHDLRRAERIEHQRRALLNLVEHTFGPLQLDQPHPDEPYRRRGPLAGEQTGYDEDDEDDDEPPEGGAGFGGSRPSTTPENT